MPLSRRSFLRTLRRRRASAADGDASRRSPPTETLPPCAANSLPTLFVPNIICFPRTIG